MKFSKSGRIVLALLVTLGVSLGITSCTSDYTIGYIYVTGTTANNTSGVAGEITGFKISNNTGALLPVSGSPFGSGGENPKRALIYSKTGRFVYVLNSGDATTGAGGNISLFFIGGSGGLNFQTSYSSQGTAPQAIVSDSSGSHLYVLDKYEPATVGPNVSTPNPTPCVGSDGVAHPVGEITVFTVDSNTGRLSPVTNTQQHDASGNNLSYFPVGCFPIDAAIAQSNLYTIQAGTAATGDLQSVFTYSVQSSGQLNLTSNAVLPTNASDLTAISTDGSNVYLLDAGPNPSSGSNLSYIIPYVAGGTSGALTIAAGGIVQNDPTVQNPVALLVESGTHNFVYVANAGPNNSTAGSSSSSAISAFNRVSSQLSLFTTSQEPIPTGSSPRCIVEDPSNQYIYTANHDSNNVTGHLLNTQHGTLSVLRHASTSFATGGNPTWCVVTGRLQ